MTSLESIAQALGIAEPWTENGGVHWLNPGTVGVRAVAAQMNAVHARFITITTYQLAAGEGFRLEYHWDLQGQLLGFPFLTQDGAIDSIFDLCEGVDWIEREVTEEYAIQFHGRAYEPLLLREGLKPGVNLREEAAK